MTTPSWRVAAIGLVLIALIVGAGFLISNSSRFESGHRFESGDPAAGGAAARKQGGPRETRENGSSDQTVSGKGQSAQGNTSLGPSSSLRASADKPAPKPDNNTGAAPAGEGKLPSKFELSRLQADCSKSIGPDGFGAVTIEGHLMVQDQAVEISVPCRVRLATGSSLTFRRVQLASRELWFTDENASGTAVVIEKSKFSGVPGSKLGVELSGSNDTVRVVGSELSYPAGILLGVFGPKDGAAAARVEVLETRLTAVDPKSEGITLGVRAVIGSGRFERLTMAVAKDAPLLMAPTCVIRKVGLVVSLCKIYEVNEP